MTFSNVNASSIGYSGNSLRFGLLDLKPVEIKETIKRAGIRFERVIRSFESSKIPTTFADMICNQNEAIFASVRIPDWFDSSRLAKELSQRSIKSYESDTEFKKAVEELKKNRGQIGRPLLSFVQFAKNRFESQMNEYLELEADRFIRSNFPLSFYNKLLVFDSTYQAFLSTLEDNVRKFEFRARCSRNFQMYEKHISEMKSVIGPMIDQIDLCFFQYFRLKDFIAIWNSKDYHELSNPKFLDINALDYQEFENLLNGYYDSVMGARNLLLRQNNDILKVNKLSENPTSNLFGKLVNLPTGSLNLGS